MALIRHYFARKTATVYVNGAQNGAQQSSGCWAILRLDCRKLRIALILFRFSV
jgi:hypothetical protein